MALFANAMIRITADASKVQSEGKKAEKSILGIGKSIKSLATAISLITGGIVSIATLKKAIKTFAEFEFSMRNVLARTEATGKEFQKLTIFAEKLGAETIFQAREVASAMNLMAGAGLETTEIMASLNGVMEFAAATQESLANSANLVISVLSAFNLEASESDRIADSLAKTITSSRASVSKLTASMKFAASAASAANQKFNTTLAVLAKLFDAGIDGSIAGTALRNVMAQLASPTFRAARMIDNLNLSIEDLNPSTNSMIDIIEKLQKGIAETNLDPLNVAMTIFGKRAGPAMLTLLRGSITELKDFKKALDLSGGTAKKMAELQIDTLRGSFELFKSAVEGLSIAIGGVFGDSIKIAVVLLSDLLLSVKSLINPIVTLTKVAIGLGGAFATFMGLLQATVAVAIGVSIPLSAIALTIGGLVLAIDGLTRLFTGGTGLIQVFLDWRSAIEGADKALIESRISKAALGFQKARNAVKELAEEGFDALITAGSKWAGELDDIQSKLEKFNDEQRRGVPTLQRQIDANDKLIERQSELQKKMVALNDEFKRRAELANKAVDTLDNFIKFQNASIASLRLEEKLGLKTKQQLIQGIRESIAALKKRNDASQTAIDQQNRWLISIQNIDDAITKSALNKIGLAEKEAEAVDAERQAELDAVDEIVEKKLEAFEQAQLLADEGIATQIALRETFLEELSIQLQREVEMFAITAEQKLLIEQQFRDAIGRLGGVETKKKEKTRKEEIKDTTMHTKAIALSFGRMFQAIGQATKSTFANMASSILNFVAQAVAVIGAIISMKMGEATASAGAGAAATGTPETAIARTATFVSLLTAMIAAAMGVFSSLKADEGGFFDKAGGFRPLNSGHFNVNVLPGELMIPPAKIPDFVGGIAAAATGGGGGGFIETVNFNVEATDFDNFTEQLEEHADELADVFRRRVFVSG